MVKYKKGEGCDRDRLFQILWSEPVADKSTFERGPRGIISYNDISKIERDRERNKYYI